MNARTAFVTGAATGIGKGLVEKLDREGWRVFAGYNRTPPDALVAACGPELRTMCCTVSDPDSVAEAARQIEEALQGAALDLLVNNAATATEATGAIENVNIEAFQRLFEVNLWGALRLTQALLPLVRKSDDPRIINVGSPSQYLTIPLGAQYPISKVALAKLTEALRIELKPFGIQVTSLEPNGVQSPMTSFPEHEKTDLWASFPEHLLGEYQRHFQYPGDVLEAAASLWTPEKFADKVYRQVVCAKKLKPRYIIGPNAWVLPTLDRWVSKSAQERLFERMFRKS
ncbi:MAG: SDR family NAD(P)-dependent oxidoreductase [Deltaproteobacteria bacterium]|nr:SDR family NAD(P)-dependent oxidoreductase [Deltaproteobacteria bacterium]